jgi:hypothetical protein
VILKMPIEFNATAAELRIIERIVDRALLMMLYPPHEGRKCRRDVNAVHSNGRRLRLADLLAADDVSFADDLFGIRTHIDRATGKLELFLPRFYAEPFSDGWALPKPAPSSGWAWAVPKAASDGWGTSF